MGVAWSQFFPPTPNLTEQNLPSQKGKVFIVTGGASGIGFELATILFQAGGKVYIAGRSESKARQSIEQIKAPTHDTPGQLEYLPLELDDLTTIKASVQAFQAKERKLDVLWNNAGISLPPLGSISKQGHELQLATNCLGPFLVTQLLLPSLHAAMEEQSSTPGSVRVVWTSSQIVDLSAPTGGPAMADIASPPPDKTQNYVASKTGNWFLAAELARAAAIPGSPAYGILSLTQNPGNLSTNLLRHASWMKLLSAPLLHRPRMGAYTELWAGLAPELTLEAHGGAYVVPWGRLHPAPRGDLLDALKSEAEGGTGRAREFWEWCERQTADYMNALYEWKTDQGQKRATMTKFAALTLLNTEGNPKVTVRVPEALKGLTKAQVAEDVKRGVIAPRHHIEFDSFPLPAGWGAVDRFAQSLDQQADIPMHNRLLRLQCALCQTRAQELSHARVALDMARPRTKRSLRRLQLWAE